MATGNYTAILEKDGDLYVALCPSSTSRAKGQPSRKRSLI
jgi:hypothetical protein